MHEQPAHHALDERQVLAQGLVDRLRILIVAVTTPAGCGPGPYAVLAVAALAGRASRTELEKIALLDSRSAGAPAIRRDASASSARLTRARGARSSTACWRRTDAAASGSLGRWPGARREAEKAARDPREMTEGALPVGAAREIDHHVRVDLAVARRQNLDQGVRVGERSPDRWITCRHHQLPVCGEREAEHRR